MNVCVYYVLKKSWSNLSQWVGEEKTLEMDDTCIAHIWRSIIGKRAPFVFFVAGITGRWDFRDGDFNFRIGKASRSWFENCPGIFLTVWVGSPGISWRVCVCQGQGGVIHGGDTDSRAPSWTLRAGAGNLHYNKLPKKSSCTLKILGKRVNQLLLESPSNLGNFDPRRRSKKGNWRTFIFL